MCVFFFVGNIWKYHQSGFCRHMVIACLISKWMIRWCVKSTFVLKMNLGHFFCLFTSYRINWFQSVVVFLKNDCSNSQSIFRSKLSIPRVCEWEILNYACVCLIESTNHDQQRWFYWWMNWLVCIFQFDFVFQSNIVSSNIFGKKTFFLSIDQSQPGEKQFKCNQIFHSSFFPVIIPFKTIWQNSKVRENAMKRTVCACAQFIVPYRGW